jgi:hypothetical protein
VVLIMGVLVCKAAGRDDLAATAGGEFAGCLTLAPDEAGGSGGIGRAKGNGLNASEAFTGRCRGSALGKVAGASPIVACASGNASDRVEAALRRP